MQGTVRGWTACRRQADGARTTRRLRRRARVTGAGADIRLSPRLGVSSMTLDTMRGDGDASGQSSVSRSLCAGMTLHSGATNPDEVAAAILDGEPLFEDVWPEIEARAEGLVETARLVGVEPRRYAAEMMLGMERSIEDDGFQMEDADVARADIAMAAALVYAGRIG